MTRARDVADSALVHIATQTFTSASTTSLNNVFTSDYENYRLVFNNVSYAGVSSTANVSLRLRASGTDTTTNYTGAGIYMAHNSATVNGATTTLIFLGNSSLNAGKIYGYIDIFGPQTATETSASYVRSYRFAAGSSGAYSQAYGFFQTDTTQFDGFSVVTSAGTISGKVTVYGYRN